MKILILFLNIIKDLVQNLLLILKFIAAERVGVQEVQVICSVSFLPRGGLSCFGVNRIDVISKKQFLFIYLFILLIIFR